MLGFNTLRNLRYHGSANSEFSCAMSSSIFAGALEMNSVVISRFFLNSFSSHLDIVVFPLPVGPKRSTAFSFCSIAAIKSVFCFS